MDKIALIKRTLENSKFLVALQGKHTCGESGCTDYKDPYKSFEIEQRYGYAPEELFNASFYNTRIEQFFEYYKNEVIADLGQPSPTIEALKKLEDRGILKTIITREIFHLAIRGGCQNVLELHGNVYENRCPHCAKSFPIEYVKAADEVPRCPDCNVPIRPQVCLIGEMLDNALITKAADQVGRADVLLVLGCNMKEQLAASMGKYFHGDKVILINEEPHYTDDWADIVVHAKPMDILPQVVV